MHRREIPETKSNIDFTARRSPDGCDEPELNLNELLVDKSRLMIWFQRAPRVQKRKQSGKRRRMIS